MKSTEMEKYGLAKVEAAVGKKYSYKVTDATLGKYEVTSDETGLPVGKWRVRGENQMPGELNKGAHVEPSCIPWVGPDNGTADWLDLLAQHACRMFYIAEAQQAERETAQ